MTATDCSSRSATEEYVPGDMIPAKGEFPLALLFLTLPRLLRALDVIVLLRRGQHDDTDCDITGHVLKALDLDILERTSRAYTIHVSKTARSHGSRRCSKIWESKPY